MMAGAIVFGLLMERLGVVGGFVRWLSGVIPDVGPVGAALAVSAITIFGTEVVSNTAAALAMWPVAEALAGSGGFAALPVMVCVGIAANCAFMSPVATGATAMAFGGLPGLRLRRMLLVGTVMNLVASALIAGVGIYSYSF